MFRTVVYKCLRRLPAGTPWQSSRSLLTEQLREDIRRGRLLTPRQHLGLGLALAQRRVHVLDRDRVDAVALVGLREALALKDVCGASIASSGRQQRRAGSTLRRRTAEVATASATHDLDALHPHADVRLRHDRSLDDLVKRRPAAPRVELGGSRVERLLARCAHEVALLRVELVVLTCRERGS